MGSPKKAIVGISSALLMLILIFDSKTALSGASDGIDLCIRTVIPSLFPFFFLSGIVNSVLSGRFAKLLRPLGKLCAIPDSAEHIFLMGLTGGYPVGAQCIASNYRSGALKKQDAERMLAFCNNAGPSFIFGMTALMFQTPAAPWILWTIQFLCALITGMVLPGKPEYKSSANASPDINLSHAMYNAIKAMAAVCGWVVVFRVLINILNRWIFWMLPTEQITLFSGILELSNGCIMLCSIQNDAVRFVIAAGITVFGGICVFLQTVSVCGTLSCKWFIIGKIMQAVISIPLSMIAAGFLFPGNMDMASKGTVFAVCIICAVLITRKIKKYTGNSVAYRV